MDKIDTKCLKSGFFYSFWWKIRPTSDPIISVIKCNRDKKKFPAERGGQSDDVGV